MARHTSRMGLVTMIASSVRAAVRPGSASLSERAAAVPRMLSAVVHGQYRGTTFAHVALLAAAVAYLVSPLDVVPEALFGVFGIADDAVVVTWLVAALVNDTEAFLTWERSGGAADRSTGRSGWFGRPDTGGRGPQDMGAEDWAGRGDEARRGQTVPGHVVG